MIHLGQSLEKGTSTNRQKQLHLLNHSEDGNSLSYGHNRVITEYFQIWVKGKVFETYYNKSHCVAFFFFFQITRFLKFVSFCFFHQEIYERRVRNLSESLRPVLLRLNRCFGIPPAQHTSNTPIYITHIQVTQIEKLWQSASLSLFFF